MHIYRVYETRVHVIVDEWARIVRYEPNHNGPAPIVSLTLTDGAQRRDGDRLHVGAPGVLVLYAGLTDRYEATHAIRKLMALFPSCRLRKEMLRAATRLIGESVGLAAKPAIGEEAYYLRRAREQMQREGYRIV